MNNKPTIETWLSDVYYDKESQYIYSGASDPASQPIGVIRGWSQIKAIFELQEAIEFQDSVGQFIVEAIREKLERLKEK